MQKTVRAMFRSVCMCVPYIVWMVWWSGMRCLDELVNRCMWREKWLECSGGGGWVEEKREELKKKIMRIKSNQK